MDGIRVVRLTQINLAYLGRLVDHFNQFARRILQIYVSRATARVPSLLKICADSRSTAAASIALICTVYGLAGIELFIVGETR